MPSNYTAAMACSGSVDIALEDDPVLSEDEENTEVHGYSQGEDTGPTDYETDSDDSQVKEPVAPAEAPYAGIRNDDDTFRARLDLEFKKYRAAKQRFLLSQIHDNTPVKHECKRFHEVNQLFEDEIIVLRDLNESDCHIRGVKEKKRRERRVKSRSRTSSRENTLDGPDNEKFGTQKDDVPSLSTDCFQEVQGAEPPMTSVDALTLQDEDPLCEDNDAPVENFHYDENLSAEQEADRERRAGLRKLYRWERFRFRSSALDVDSLGVALAPLVDTANRLEVTEKYAMGHQERREKIADSLFKDESSKHKNVRYIDPKDTGLHRPAFFNTASNYFQSMPEKLPAPAPSVKQDKAVASESKPTGTAGANEAQSAVGVKSEPAVGDAKKDRKSKTKKRRSSSSSEDLEELERKSEARLGKRK